MNQAPTKMNQPTPSRYRWEWNGVSFDFYRLCEILGIQGGPKEHALKKIIRAGQSIKPIEQDIDEAIDALVRWKEMINEDKNTKRTNPAQSCRNLHRTKQVHPWTQTTTNMDTKMELQTTPGDEDFSDLRPSDAWVAGPDRGGSLEWWVDGDEYLVAISLGNGQYYFAVVTCCMEDDEIQMRDVFGETQALYYAEDVAWWKPGKALLLSLPNAQGHPCRAADGIQIDGLSASDAPSCSGSSVR